MAVKQTDCSVPQGKFYIGDFGGSLQLALPAGGVITPQTSLIQNSYLGLSEESKINNEIEEPQVTNMDGRSGGLACYASYVKKSMLDVSVISNRAETAALANYGFLREFTGGAVTGELKTVIKNATSAVSRASKNTFIPFNRVPDPTVPYVITNVGATVTYVLGTDYLQVETGIELLPGSTVGNATAPAYAPNLACNYTALDTQRVDGLTVLSKPQSVYFDGFDRMSGASRQGWVYNAMTTVKTYPTKTKDVFKCDFSFVLLPDPRIPYVIANPTSQYYHFLNS